MLHGLQDRVEALELSTALPLPTFPLYHPSFHQHYDNLLAASEVTKTFLPSLFTFLCDILSIKHIPQININVGDMSNIQIGRNINM